MVKEKPPPPGNVCEQGVGKQKRSVSVFTDGGNDQVDMAFLYAAFTGLFPGSAGIDLNKAVTCDESSLTRFDIRLNLLVGVELLWASEEVGDDVSLF
jgi:hypothetical protein